MQAGIAMPGPRARGIYNDITGDGRKECAAQAVASAGLRSVDYITRCIVRLLLLKMDRALSPAQRCTLLFREVMGKLFDK